MKTIEQKAKLALLILIFTIYDYVSDYIVDEFSTNKFDAFLLNYISWLILAFVIALAISLIELSKND